MYIWQTTPQHKLLLYGSHCFWQYSLKMYDTSVFIIDCIRILQSVQKWFNVLINSLIKTIFKNFKIFTQKWVNKTLKNIFKTNSTHFRLQDWINSNLNKICKMEISFHNSILSLLSWHACYKFSYYFAKSNIHVLESWMKFIQIKRKMNILIK